MYRYFIRPNTGHAIHRGMARGRRWKKVSLPLPFVFTGILRTRPLQLPKG